MRLFCLWSALAAGLHGADVPSASEQQRAAAQAGLRVAMQQQRHAISMQLQSARPGASAASSSFQLPALAKSLVPAPAFEPPPCDPMPMEEADVLMRQAAQREGVSIDLLRAVIHQESGFRPCAVSPKGAIGLMQLMPATASQFGLDDPFDPRQNIDSGARLLKQLLTRYGGDVSLALGAYNAGPARVDASGGVPAIEETVRYVQSILGSLPVR